MPRKRNLPTPVQEEAVSNFEAVLKQTIAVHPHINPATRRPYGISPEQRMLLVETISAGNFFSTACQLAGVAQSTFQDWMDRGKADDAEEPYKSFATAIRLADATAEQSLHAKIAADPDWRASWQLLSRRYPERWAEQKGNLQVATTGDVRIVLPDNKRDSGDLSELES